MKEAIIVPKMGESITEGTIVKWFKKQGSFVKKNENVVLISTDKVEAEIPSSSEGVLIDIIAKEGDTLTVGSILGYIELSSHTNIQENNRNSKIEELNTNKNKHEKCDSTLLSSHRKTTVKKKYNTVETKTPHIDKRIRNQNIFSLIKNIVNKYGINLQKLINIKATLKGKKIYRSNVLTLIKSKSIITSKETNLKRSEKKYKIKPISRFRSVIMKNMLQSKKISAHVSTFFKVNYSNIKMYKNK